MSHLLDGSLRRLSLQRDGYQERLMPFLKRKQRMVAKFASSFAPRTAFGITFRNLVLRLLRLTFVVDFFFGRELRDEIKLADYGF